MAAEEDPSDREHEPAAADLLFRGVDLAALPDEVHQDAVGRGQWLEADEEPLGAEVSGCPLVVETGVLAVVAPDGRPIDLIGPGRIRAPNATHTLWPLVPSRLLTLPIDVLGTGRGRGRSPSGPAAWAATLQQAVHLSGPVLDADVTLDEALRRLDAAAGRSAAVTGMDAPAALHRDHVTGAPGTWRVRDVATMAPAIDAHAPVIEALTALITSGVSVAPVVSGDVPVGAFGVDELPLPVGPATRAACRRRGRPDGEAVAELAAIGPAVAVELLDDGAEASAIARALTSITVEVIRWVVESAASEFGPPPAAFAWLAFGSLARGELLPDSDLDTGLAWDMAHAPGGDRWFADLAERSLTRLRELGYHPDPNGVSADRPEWCQDMAGWQRSVRTWTDPTQRHELVGVGIALDVRPVAGALPADEILREALVERVRDSAARSTLAADAVRQPAPKLLARRTGWRSEQLRRRLDLKRDLMAPIVDLARMQTLSREGFELSTLERLAASAVAGAMDPRLAVALRDGFDLALRLRLARAVGRAPPVAPSGYGVAFAPAIRALSTAQRNLRLRHGLTGS